MERGTETVGACGDVESEEAVVRSERYCTLKLPGRSLCVMNAIVNIPQRGTLYNPGRWLIESMTKGDGTEDRNGLAMDAGVVHGAAQAKSDHKVYHTIELDTATFSGFGDGAVRIPTFSVPCSLASRPDTPTPVCSVSERRFTRRGASIIRAEILSGNVHGFLARNPGVGVIINRVSA